MLPPAQSDNGSAICASSEGDKILTWDGASSIKCNKDSTIDSSGNMGVGTASPRAKLDVGGGVKIGNDSDACAATKSGTVRWDGSTMEYCNGTAWVGFAPQKDTYWKSARGAAQGINCYCDAGDTVLTGGCVTASSDYLSKNAPIASPATWNFSRSEVVIGWQCERSDATSSGTTDTACFVKCEVQ